MNEPVQTKVGPRGRITVPVALQRAAGIGEEDEVFLRVLGPGVIVVETRQALRARVRAAVPDGAEYDAVAEIRAMRDRTD